MKRLAKVAAAVSMFTAAAGCGNKETGRIVGFVVNGQTGQRVNAFAADDSLQNLKNDSETRSNIYAIVEGSFRRAEPCGKGDINEENAIGADGCYRIEGVPTNTATPVIATIDTYERFHGQVNIDDNRYEQEDVRYTDPQVVGNIRVFPLGYGVDYRVALSLNNRRIAGGTVSCQLRQTTPNSFQTDGDFLIPQNTTSGNVSAQSDGEGIAQLPGAQLVNGGSYTCEVFYSTPNEGRVVSGALTFVAGVSAPDQFVTLDSSPATGALVALSSNNDNPNALLGNNATLVIKLNKPAEIFPGTADCQVATLAAPNTDGDATPAGVLPTDAVGNGASETMTASLSADGLTLTLAYQAPTTPLDTDDLNTSVTFNGVYLRSK
ncbi:MAG TPA: hypothetical protein VEY30_03690, partial [Myxococcaceae bacterium]|nr:hypothetical protein [Myxococcaceae bacterium]